MKRTAAEYREDAKRNYKARARSIENFDTDGFVTNYCHNLSARLAEARALLVENDETAIFIGLYEGDRRVKAKIIKTKFGNTWLIHKDEIEIVEMRGKPFVPTGRNSRIHKNLGLTERRERAPAWCTFGDNGTKGLAGLTTVFIEYYRTGDKWGGDAILEGGEDAKHI
jgi:hypothetical protein